MYKTRPSMKPSQFRKLQQLRKRVVCERNILSRQPNEVKEELYDTADHNVLVSFRVGPTGFDGPLHAWDYWYVLIGPKGRAAVYASPKRYHQYAGTFIPQMGLHFAACCRSVSDLAKLR